MRPFADTREFKAALLDVIRQASQPRVSRHVLAGQLETLAGKLGVAKKPRKKKPAAPPPPPQVLRNIGAEEAKVLGWLEGGLDSALHDVKREKDYAADAAADLKREEEVTGEKADDKNPWDPGKFFVGQVTKYLSDNVEWLARTLEEHAPVTQEDELARAVRDFFKKIPLEGTWPKDGDAKLFDDVAKALGEAKALVPKHLTKPSELGGLRKTFEAIARAIKLMTGKTIQVPKIPNALEDADPRQLGFGFTASSPMQARLCLSYIWKMAHAQHPSRAELAEALYATARAVNP